MLRPPALNAVPCWRVEQRDGTAFVRERLAPAKRTLPGTGLPDSVVIIGGGAAGNMAAETLRQEGYTGPITLLGADPAPPCDRPNLSKDYLAGTAEADWIPLRPNEFHAQQGIDLKPATAVAALEPAARAVRLKDGSRLSYGALLLATGAEPIRLQVPGGRSAACARVAHTGRQRRLDRRGKNRPASGGDRRQLHRPGGRRVLACPPDCRACRCT